MQYLATRYNKGKAAVNKMMEARHNLVSVNSLVGAHGVVVSKQAELGSTAFLNPNYDL